MSITQGRALPDVTVTTTKADTAPDYYTKYLQGLAGVGTSYTGAPAGADGTGGILAKTAEQGIAGYDPLQTSGYGMLENRAGLYSDYLKDADVTAGTAAAGLDPSRIAKLMDPYQKNVVDEMTRLSQQNIQRNVLPSLKAGFVGGGNLGSQRYAGALGQTLAEMQANLTGQQYGALSKGYSEAMRAALEELGIQNQAARTQMDLGKTAQELGLTEAGALTKAGAEKQLYEQSKLDYPLKTAQTVSGLMRGLQVPMTQGETRVGPLAGAYETSDLSNVLGILSVLGAMKQGSSGDQLVNWAASKIGKITNLLGGGTFTVDPAEYAGVNTGGIPVYFDKETSKYYDYNGNEVPVTFD